MPRIQGVDILNEKRIIISLQYIYGIGKTKAKKPRRVPISAVLRGVLHARRLDPAGDPLPPSAFVFGDAVGRRRRSTKTAWRLTCQRAKITGLHFHDLRREAGSRWMEASVPLATIQRWLGHTNIAQTSTYLATTTVGEHEAMRRFEERVGRLTPLDTDGGTPPPVRPRSAPDATDVPLQDTVKH